jgi:hypothetical protein
MEEAGKNPALRKDPFAMIYTEKCGWKSRAAAQLVRQAAAAGCTGTSTLAGSKQQLMAAGNGGKADADA